MITLLHNLCWLERANAECPHVDARTWLAAALQRKQPALQAGHGRGQQPTDLVPLLAVGGACGRGGGGSTAAVVCCRTESIRPRQLAFNTFPCPSSTSFSASLTQALSVACTLPNCMQACPSQHHTSHPLAFANEEGLPHCRVAGTACSPHHLQVLGARHWANALQEGRVERPYTTECVLQEACVRHHLRAPRRRANQCPGEHGQRGPARVRGGRD